MTARDPLSVAFAALADPTRRDILMRLRSGTLTVSNLAAVYPISRPAVSQHLTVLENAGLVARAQRARWNDCSLAISGLDEAARWIEQQRAEWTERFELLDEHLKRRRAQDPKRTHHLGEKTAMIDASKGFTLVRTFAATPEEVWEAWTDADSAAQWWRPRGTSTPRETVEIDARVGGRYTYTMVNDATGIKVVTAGTYREVVPFERLVFTWGNPSDDSGDTPVITVTLEPAGEGTLMTFDLRGVDGAKGDGSFYDGWDEVLDSLGKHLEHSQAAR